MKLIYGNAKSGKRNNCIYVNEYDLEIPIGIEGYQKSLDFIDNLEKQTRDQKKISEIFKLYDYSLWGFIFPTIYPSIQKSINFIVAINELIEKVKPTSIEIVGEFDKYEIFQQICNNRNIPLITLNHFNHKILKLKIYEKLQHLRYNFIFKQKNEKRIKIFKNKKRIIPNLDGKILFVTSTAYRRKIFSAETGKSEPGEYIQDQMIDLIKSKHKTVAIDIDYSFHPDLNILNDRLNEKIPWFPIECIDKKNLDSKSSQEFIHKFNQILKSDKFKSFFTFNEINFWQQIKFDFKKLTFLPHIPNYIQLIETMTRFFANNKPDVIFLPYETGPYALAVIIAANRNNIKTIGIQHGLIWKDNSDYSHKEFRTKQNKFEFPLPDKILLFGEFAKKILLEIGYPENKLVTFGNPEFFQVNEIIENFDYDKTKSLFKIDKNKKIILFTTGKSQSYYNNLGGRLNYDEQVLEKLLSKYNNNDNFYVILKPHPDENTEIYEKIISKHKSTNFQIIQDNLMQLILISDVVISIFSSVLMDAITLGKMTIRVKFPKSHVPIPYDEYNVLISSELKLLPKSIELILTNEEIRKELDKNMKFFIKYMYTLPVQNQKELLNNLIKNE